MMLTRRDLCKTILMSGGFTLGACSSTPSPTPVGVMIYADANINPNEDGSPAPIVVRIYELKGMTAFNNADFFDFVDNDKKLLGADLIGSSEYELVPGATQKYNRSVSNEATHIGVVAGFRDIKFAQWRDSIELQKEKTNNFDIFLTSLAVRIQNKPSRFGIF